MSKPKDKLPKLVPFDKKKHLPQFFSEKLNDLFYILSTLYIADREEKDLTKLTLEKVLFKTNEEFNKEKKAFFNTYFFINSLGPHNNVFYKYFEELEEAELIKLEGRKIFLTAKGLRVMTDLVNLEKNNALLKKVLFKLLEYIEKYADNPDLAIKETHQQEVIDTTDENKKKSVEKLIKEIKPGKRFEDVSEFKYIEFLEPEKVKQQIEPGPIVKNELQAVLVDVEESDYKEIIDCDLLFR